MKNNVRPPLDVYDCATMRVITPLSGATCYSTDNYPWETSFVLNNNDGVVWANEDEVFS